MNNNSDVRKYLEKTESDGQVKIALHTHEVKSSEFRHESAESINAKIRQFEASQHKMFKFMYSQASASPLKR